MKERLRILLLSGYDAASHRQWREGLVRSLPEFEWRSLALPDRHFYWRVRGNPLAFAFQHREVLAEPTDLLVATSMVDLATLRGFVPSLARLPTLLYFHENQFAYPTRKPGSNIVNAQLTSVFSALCATKILFNSRYNLGSFFNGAQLLLKKMPDGVPAGLLDGIKPLASVLPVPIEPLSFAVQKRQWTAPLQIVWNHRWEYDKQPQVFFDAMRLLRSSGLNFRLHVMGQSFREIPDCFEVARHEFSGCIDTWGHQSQEVYEETLVQAHVVVSAALHDFQGLSMLEAIQRGCVPVAPDRVAYPDYVPAALRYQTGNAASEAKNLAQTLMGLLDSPPPALSVDDYLTTALIEKYRHIFLEMADTRSG